MPRFLKRWNGNSGQTCQTHSWSLLLHEHVGLCVCRRGISVSVDLGSICSTGSIDWADWESLSPVLSFRTWPGIASYMIRQLFHGQTVHFCHCSADLILDICCIVASPFSPHGKAGILNAQEEA